MPSTGGYAPSPERYGSGDGGSGKTLLQRVFESLASQRGSAYDQTLSSHVGVETMAYARAITFDGYGANQRLANNFLPSRMTAAGTLGRWEKILGLVVQPTDTEPVRRARVAAKLALFGQPNSVQPVVDALKALLGNLFVGVTHFDTSNALIWWPGLTGTAAGINTTTPSAPANFQLYGLANVQPAWYGATITLSNCANAPNNGTFPIYGYVNSTTINSYSSNLYVPDYGVGGTSGAPTIHWSVTGPVPWSSTIAHVDIELTIPSGYGSANTPNALWYSTVAQIGPVMDEILPAWATWSYFVNSSHGAMEFRLDEHNLGLEAFA